MRRLGSPASADGKTLATRDLTRTTIDYSVIRRQLTKSADGVSGWLMNPVKITGGPVLIFGGSEGGNSLAGAAALLAEHGHPALSLGYFRADGLPPTLRDVPLEYFAAAARLLSPHAPVSVIGYSRGTEAAQLLAENFPGLVRAVVLYAPADEVRGSLPSGGDAWLLGGQPVLTTTIPLDRLRAPILTVSGGADGLGGSEAASWRIKKRHPSTTSLIYPDAGHIVGTFPYDAAGIRDVNPTSHELDQLGGTRAADAHAQADSWPKVLAFLAKAT
ncbi:MAG: hypothetical protein QOI35_3565 [Cryptosporangiaceae bacterium]|nr:hypothetical protein [Cryptosporangiaceae bacterium]